MWQPTRLVALLLGMLALGVGVWTHHFTRDREAEGVRDDAPDALTEPAEHQHGEHRDPHGHDGSDSKPAPASPTRVDIEAAPPELPAAPSPPTVESESTPRPEVMTSEPVRDGRASAPPTPEEPPPAELPQPPAVPASAEASDPAPPDATETPTTLTAQNEREDESHSPTPQQAVDRPSREPVDTSAGMLRLVAPASATVGERFMTSILAIAPSDIIAFRTTVTWPTRSLLLNNCWIEYDPGNEAVELGFPLEYDESAPCWSSNTRTSFGHPGPKGVHWMLYSMLCKDASMMQIEAYSGRWKAQKSGGRVVARLEFLVLETAGDLVMLESRTKGHDDLGGSGALDPRGRPMIGGPMDSSVRLFARTRLEDWEENILRVVEDKRPSTDRPIPLELPARGIKILRPTGSGSAR